MSLKKIISGGQTGADFAGLEAGRALGIKTGGTAPKGWRICVYGGRDASNPRLSEYGLTKHESRDYPPRTRKNVADSDGTVWFGWTESPGAKLTIDTAVKMGKHLIVNPTAEELREWVDRHQSH